LDVYLLTPEIHDEEVGSLRNLTIDVATEDRPSVSRGAILGLLFLLQTGTSLVMLSFGSLIPFLWEDFNIRRAEVGLSTSLSFTAGTLLGMFCGRLIDKFHVRRFLSLGPGIVGLFSLFMSQVHSLAVCPFCQNNRVFIEIPARASSAIHGVTKSMGRN